MIPMQTAAALGQRSPAHHSLSGDPDGFAEVCMFSLIGLGISVCVGVAFHVATGTFYFVGLAGAFATGLGG
ncbi:MAG: hypothetical protein WCF20_08255 [Methylovirgula sp.]